MSRPGRAAWAAVLALPALAFGARLLLAARDEDRSRAPERKRSLAAVGPTTWECDGGAFGFERVVARHDSTLVVVEHRIETWLPVVDRVVVLAAGGGVVADGPPGRVFAAHGAMLADLGAWVPGRPAGAVRRTEVPAPVPLLEARALTIGYDRRAPVATGLEVTVPVATSTVVTGPNASGKTTLALTLAGLLPVLGGSVVAPALATRRGPHPGCLLYTSPSPRDRTRSRMPSSA